MSKRVKIAVIREATLNAKPTDTHYLAEGGLKISRRDARALKGTTLYYEVLVDLGEVKGFDFIPGRDVPVYQTDSEPVLALDPQSLKLVDWKEQIVEIPATHVSFSHSIDSTLIPQNAPVDPEPVVSPTPQEIQQMIENARPAEVAPVKRKPGRPKKIVADAPPAPAPEVIPYTLAEPVLIIQEPTDFEVTEKQDDESTFLIDPNSAPPAPVVQSKPEFSFDVDEDEAPPPPVRNTPQNLDFVVEDEETPASAPAAVPAEKPESTVETEISTDDFADVEPGLFDE